MYERILVPIDGSATSDQGLQEAIRLARLTGAKLRVMHVVDVLSMLALGGEGYVGAADDLMAPVREAGAQVLSRAADTVRAAGVEVESASFENVTGRVAELVVDEAVRWDADLIVLGTHGRRGVRRLMLGSDAEHIARQAPVPVLLVRDKATGVP
jgi:nucleotide-binding universal stress UspA family protein